MPGVERQSAVERPIAGLGMFENLIKVRIAHRIEQRRPSLMNTIDDGERNVDRQFAVRELGPAVFVVGHDRRRFVLGQRKLEPYVRVDMTVSNVMPTK